ncbi:MAG: FAD-dependent oxidoreductase, partial [Acidimicrobiia bacterium]|nr:FAD-dependent oxidoreductase [Acidimicrobiia bacterium]
MPVPLWETTLPAELRTVTTPLGGDAQVDVAIVGAGFTGLWTAYYLAGADPTLRIIVLEREHVGFGASGRNGGWCSALLPTSLTTLASTHGRDRAIDLLRAMHATVEEVARVADEEGIDAQLARGGTLTFARSEVQDGRLLDEVREARSFGFGPQDVRMLTAGELTDRCRVTRARSAMFTPHCAAVHPARLVHGLAGAAQRRGVVIHEQTAVVAADGRRVTTERGTVTADAVITATEAYTAALPGRRRDLVPLYSLMVGTEPLPPAVWDEIGLDDRPTFNDGRHMIIYGQRTADGRLAFGGRGAPYHFGSRIEPSFDTDDRVRRLLIGTARDLFPVLTDVEFPYHWGGPLGVPRDWHAGVRFDRDTGAGAAGGYVGDGVAATNLAGRLMADLVTGRTSELTALPWAGHRSRRWEPEPLRWLGINLGR